MVIEGREEEIKYVSISIIYKEKTSQNKSNYLSSKGLPPKCMF